MYHLWDINLSTHCLIPVDPRSPVASLPKTKSYLVESFRMANMATGEEETKILGHVRRDLPPSPPSCAARRRADLQEEDSGCQRYPAPRHLQNSMLSKRKLDHEK